MMLGFFPLQLLVTFWIVLVHDTGNAASAANVHLFQKARFHLQKLTDTLDEIDFHHNHNGVSKRSASGDDEDLRESMAAICARLNLPRRTDNKSDDKQRASKYGVVENNRESSTVAARGVGSTTRPKTLNPEPPVFPTRVEANRVGDKVNITFFVRHKVDAFVQKLSSLQNQRVELHRKRNENEKNKDTNSLSTVNFLAETYSCQGDGGNEAEYVFSRLSDFQSAVMVDIDVCRFDKIYNQEHYNFTQSEQKKFSQDITLPWYEIESDPGNDIILQDGENVIMVMNIVVSQRYRVFLTVSLVDWDTNDTSNGFAELALPWSEEEGNGLKIRQHNLEEGKNMINVDILNEELVNGTKSDLDSSRNDGNDEKSMRELHAKIRVRIATGLSRRSGEMWINCFEREPEWESRPIARKVSVGRHITLKLLDKIGALPRFTATVHNRTFGCDDNGNQNGDKYGKNCTVKCHSWGRDIHSIAILKAGLYRLPVRSNSYVLFGRQAFAMHDVGPASPDNEGTYRCVIFLKNGDFVEKSFKLFTSGFTKMEYRNIEDFQNGTSQVTCSASGVPPLEMLVSVEEQYSGNYTRIDNLIENVATVTTEGRWTNLSLLLSTDQLQYPQSNVRCEARGERGGDSQIFYIDEYLGDNYNPFIPKMIRDKSDITNHGNGTTTILCVASGSDDMDMVVSYGGTSEYYRIDKNPSWTRTVTNTADGRSILLVVSTQSLMKSSSWLYCGATNQFDYDWISFDLDSYGIHN